MNILLKLLVFVLWGQLGLYVGYAYLAWCVRKLEKKGSSNR